MTRLTSPRGTCHNLLATACLAALASTAAPPIRRNNLFTEDGARNLAQRNDLPDAGGVGTLSPVMAKADFDGTMSAGKADTGVAKFTNTGTGTRAG